MADNKQPLSMQTSFGGDPDDWVIRKAIVNEQTGRLSEIRVEALCKKQDVKLQDLLGQSMSIVLTDAAGDTRSFSGIVAGVTKLALRGGLVHLLFDVRPWFWLLTKTTDSRIFQNMTVIEIIQKIIGEHGFGADLQNKTSETYLQREYTVQYRESDFDFLSRLMEQEGIYYFFDYPTVSEEKLVLCDSKSAHKSLPRGSTLDIIVGSGSDQKTDDSITSFQYGERISQGLVEFNDWDFEKPNAKPTVRGNGQLSQKHSYKKLEHYDYPGHHRSNTNLGKAHGTAYMDGEEQQSRPVSGTSTVWRLATGYLFKAGERDDVKGFEYLIKGATHYMQATDAYDDTALTHEGTSVNIVTDVDNYLEFPDYAQDIYASSFDALDSSIHCRSPQVTPWPEISGLQTAIVTGPSGEEIYTDKYGRIKVQFHWDREGKKDEKTTCWVRVVTPWSGKNWGMIHIPRIGQEVVIQFEEGNPDRPICTGMLYNADTMPPYALPANATKSGIVTRTSKEGSTKTFNELMFEDKKDAELVRFQAQKDHEKLVKNKSTITIGYDELDKGGNGGDGCLSQVVKKNVDETIKEGDHTFKIETGSQTVEIKTDQTETIEGKSTRTVTGNNTETIKTGNKTTTVNTGNIQVDAKSGKITVTAMQSIELKVGSSSIKLDPTSITVKSTMIKVQANAKLDAKSPMTTVNGDAMLTLKGGLTMIN